MKNEFDRMVHWKTGYSSLLLAVIMAIISYSCKVGKSYVNTIEIPDNLYGTIPKDTNNMATLRWKDIFTNPQLQDLISEGILNNLDLKTAMANIKAAEANFTQSKRAFLPALSIAGSTAGYHPAHIQGSNTQIDQLYALSSWQMDIWGKLSSTKRAMYANYLASEAYKQAVQTQLVANIASAYYQLLAYDAQLTILQQSLADYAIDTTAMRVLLNSDVVSGAAVVQSAANYYAVLATVPDVKNNIHQTENTLSLLLGKTPGNILRDSLFHIEIYEKLTTGIPTQLLANRPDVREAELQLRSNFELINVAKTYFYPSFTITAESGLYTSNLSSFFQAGAFFANIIGGLTQPIFNNGLNKQRQRVAEANFNATQFNYSKVLLTAGQEVSNALYQFQMVSEKSSSRKAQIVNLEKAVRFTKELLKYTSTTNYTDVLTSEQNLLTAKQNAVNDRLQQLQAVVQLYAALGGGWK